MARVSPWSAPLPDLDFRKRRARVRAWRRGTREADLIVGGFADRHLAGWGAAEMDWFEAVLEESDVEVMAWALGTAEPPAALDGPLMAAMRRLDFVALPAGPAAGGALPPGDGR